MTPEQFMANFGAIAEAPDGIRQLRQLVLQLGLTGRLGTGRPSDRDAARLIAAIQDDQPKQKAKRKPKSQPAPPPWGAEVPKRWTVVQLGDVAEARLGKMLDKQKNKGQLRPYLRNLNVQWFEFVLSDISEMRIEDEEVKELALRDGDLLVCEGGEPGRAAIWRGENGPMFFQKALHRVRPLGGIVPELIALRLRLDTWNGSLSELFTGATIKHLTGRSLAAYSFPLPPLAEQKRIVAKVEQLMAMLDELEQRQEKKRTIAIHVSTASLDSLVDAEDRDQLAQAWRRVSENFGAVAGADQSAVSRMTNAIRSLAVFGRLTSRDQGETAEAVLATARAEHHAAVEKKSTKKTPKHSLPRRQLPPGWKWTVLADLLVFGPRNGFSPKPVNYETPILSLTLSATTSGEFDDSATKFVDIEVEPDSHLWLRPGDILVQRGNTLEYVGVPALFSGAPSRFIYPDLMMKIRVSEALDPEFVHLAMSEDSARNFLRSRASGTSGSMPKINQGALLTLPIPVPPLDEQRRIVAKVRHLMAALRALDTRSSALRAAATRLANAAVAVA